MFYTLHNSNLSGQPVLSGLTPYDASRGKRVVKDCLRVGKWKAGQKDWIVTDDTLKTLANDFAAMQANGVRSSLYWGARPDGGPMGQHGVQAKDVIAPIDQVLVQDGVLYCSAYVSDEQYKLLTNSALGVSVGVKPNWEHGDKANPKAYSLALLHVAIVDQPVVTHQGPFLTLANESVASVGFRVGDRVRVKPGREHSKMEMGNGAVVTVSTPALGVRFDGMKDIHKWYVADELESASNSGGMNMSHSQKDEDEMTPELKTFLENLQGQLKTQSEAFIALSNEFTAFKNEHATNKANAAKDAWGAKLKSLFDAQKINAVTLEQYTKLGESAGFNLALLAPLDGLVMLSNESGVQKLADGKPPMDEGTGIESDEAMAARIKARGGDPTKMPKLGK